MGCGRTAPQTGHRARLSVSHVERADLKLFVIAVGTRMPAWVEQGYAEYAKRMPPESRLQLIELRPEKRDGKSTAQILANERTRIEAALPASALPIVLDEAGKSWNTLELSRNLKHWKRDGHDAAFIIGSADGLDDAIKSRAQTLVSLSALTLPHALVRVILAEQLYRAASILQNHPYHRA